jgi:ribosomal protein L40E
MRPKTPPSEPLTLAHEEEVDLPSKWIRSRTVFLAIVLTAAYFFGAIMPEVHAWSMNVNPMSRTTVPGGTVTYTVSVFYDTPTDALFPSVLLLVSPPEPQVSVTFTYDNPDPHPPPYTATMTVHVDNSKPPGTYTLYLWANPSGTPFPGPGNREIDLKLVVAGGAGGAGGQVHLSVPHSPLSVGQPVYIEYYTDSGTDGMITLMITRGIPPMTGPIFWTKGPEAITGGLLYDVTAPGLDTPGTYYVIATVELTGGGSIDGQTTFKVGAGGIFSFTIALSPGSVEVNQGETAHYKILLTYSDPSYSGTVVNIQLSGLGPGMDSHLTEAGDLTVTTSPTTPTGTYTITAIGSAMGVTRQASATLLVTAGQLPPSQFDFELSISPTERTVAPGGSATFTVTVSLVAGSAQNVLLSLSGPPDMMASGVVSGTFSPSSGNPAYTSVLTLATTSSVSPGSYSLTVTGTGGGKTRTATMSLIVSQAAEFRIDVTPDSQTVNQGETASYSISVVGIGGFNSAVSLTVSGLPSGSNGVLSVPSGTPNFFSTLTVTLPGNVPTGSFTLTITGTGGDLTKIANAVLNVNPTKTTLPPPTQTTTTVQPPGPSFPDLTWIIVGILAVLIVIFAALALRRRQPAYQPTPPAQPTPPTAAEKTKPSSSLYCVNCGTENPSTNEFCGKCGQKLLRSTVREMD